MMCTRNSTCATVPETRVPETFPGCLHRGRKKRGTQVQLPPPLLPEGHFVWATLKNVRRSVNGSENRQFSKGQPFMSRELLIVKSAFLTGHVLQTVSMFLQN